MRNPVRIGEEMRNFGQHTHERVIRWGTGNGVMRAVMLRDASSTNIASRL